MDHKCDEGKAMEFNGHKIEACPHEPPKVDGEPLGLTPKAIERRLNEDIAERRQIFVGALYAKAEQSHLKRVDALIILQATLAEMLVPAIDGLKEEASRIEPGSIPRANADLMVEIAQELRAEALHVVDHAMANSRLVIMPRMPR